MAESAKHLIWPWWVRLCHWALVAGFVADYFVLSPGSGLHNWLGYAVTALVVLRIVRGLFPSAGYASFASCHLSRRAFTRHWAALTARQLPSRDGHNPFGWIMVFIIWFLVAALAVTGFLVEEVGYFFGNQLLEDLHLWAADALLVAALVHIAAVLLVGRWGRVALIGPMIVGTRKLK